MSFKRGAGINRAAALDLIGTACMRAPAWLTTSLAS